MRDRVIGICSSPNSKESTTLTALKAALKVCGQNGLKSQIIELSGLDIKGCTDCSGCRNQIRCSQKDDFEKTIIPILSQNDIGGIIFASPVYFGGISSQMKAVMDRSIMFRRNGFKFHNVVAGAITVGHSRNGGQELATMDIVRNALIQGMIVVSDAPPTSHFGGSLWSGHDGGIEKDEAGLQTAVNLGKNISELVNKLKS